MRKVKLALVCALFALSGCAVAKVPVKAAGTAAGVSVQAAGTAVMVVTRDRHELP